VLLVCIERNRDVSFPVELSHLAESKKIRLHQPAINLSPVKFSYRRSSVAKCEILVNVRDTTPTRTATISDISRCIVSYFCDALYIFFDVRYVLSFARFYTSFAISASYLLASSIFSMRHTLPRIHAVRNSIQL